MLKRLESSKNLRRSGPPSKLDKGQRAEITQALQLLSDEERRELENLFNLVDLDRGGTISAEEWGKLLRTLGIEVSPEEIKQMVQEIDLDGDGVVNFGEFVFGMTRYKRSKSNSEDGGKK